jgi:hypothetical protein
MNAVPAHLEQKYVPRLKDVFRTFADITEALEFDPTLLKDPAFAHSAATVKGSIKAIYDEFRKDGGTQDEWNALSPAVHNGEYGPY